MTHPIPENVGGMIGEALADSPYIRMRNLLTEVRYSAFYPMEGEDCWFQYRDLLDRIESELGTEL